MNAWVYCYANECCKPPDLFPHEFAIAAERIINRDLHLEKSDITTNNAKVHLLVFAE